MMAGTTAAIARLLRDGSLTLSACASGLGLSREQLEDRLRLMEQQDYLARVTRPYPDESCTCRHCCASCCRKTIAPAPAIFVLTEKGERLLPGTGNA
ncbi:MAG: hypothetical protein EHM53_01430 [Methanoregulaceae archaeon]|nr:MAG: hypothetical protein EHM53_01430 [Methanoregulaceae archaeon]